MTKPTKDGPHTEYENAKDQLSAITNMHSEQNEDFLKKPSKVNQLLQFLDQMGNENKLEEDAKDKSQFEDISAGVTDTNFMVCKRTVYNDRMSLKRSKSKNKVMGNTNQFTFMRQIDESIEERAITRIEREGVAENFRRMGNFEYRRNSFDAAIQLYTKGLSYIVDTPVLYVNRALCYIKLRNYKRAIMDCDHVIQNIDKKCLRAWLYRAASYKRLNDEKNFEYSIYKATSLNSSQSYYIQTFLEKMRTVF